MNTQNEDKEVVRSEYFDPFPEPQTIPSGWDMSAILTAPTSDSVQQTKDSSGTESN
ncbi:MAG TPA: hypothetical protein VLA72_22545 [Anaerolineales bacterium]|nr:hypothetical protein [Anaerolineales bacterium]